MPDPTLRQLLEFSRPIQEFSQAIQTSLRLIQAAVAAEGQGPWPAHSCKESE